MTSYRLARVETVVRALLADASISATDLRVRDLGDTVRVEVDPTAIRAMAALRGLEAALAEAGFADASLQIDAFVSGRLNTENR